jgi:hypothetical protein
LLGQIGADASGALFDTSEGRQQNRRVELIVSGEVIGTKIISLSLQPVASSSANPQ